MLRLDALPPQIRWGILFGLPQAALVLAGAIAGAIGLGEDLGMGADVTFGYLFLPILLFVVSALLYLAGKRAARQTHRSWDGAVAGLVAAEMCAVSITGIAWLIGVAHGAPPGYFFNRLFFPALAAAIVGIALGMLGGIVAAL
jgi:hypothetical protein